jgi:DNA-binding transcriptional LysR family regulator
MSKLPDLEGLAIFAKVVEMRSFAAAASELKLSKATVSKAVSRLEARLGARLINRTSRRLALTDAGRQLSSRAAHILAEGEAAEDHTLAQSTAPRGLVRLAAPMSFGVLHVAPLLPEFLAAYPEVSIDLHLSDETVDVIGDGFDAAIRIAALPDSSLVARRLCGMPTYLVGAPAYLSKHGRPKHPLHLAGHRCIGYAYATTRDTWHFTNKAGESATVRPSGPLRVNNGDAMMPALIAGVGLGVLPEFVVRDALADGRLERLLPDWSLPSGAVHWIAPPGGPRPKRVEVLGDFFTKKLSRRTPRAMTAEHAASSRSEQNNRRTRQS